MSDHDVELMEEARVGGDYYENLPELTDEERAEAVETAMRRSVRLRDRIVSAAEVVLAEEGFHLEEFLEE